MTERALWAYLRRGMRGRWHAQRHEDALSAGIPDVSYACGGADGWIELKRAEVDRSGRVRAKFRPGQVGWLAARARRGRGLCWVLLRVGRRDHYLVHASALPILAAGATVEELGEAAVGAWEGRVDFGGLADLLAGRPA